MKRQPVTGQPYDRLIFNVGTRYVEFFIDPYLTDLHVYETAARRELYNV